jgi:hypothetical protein
MLEIELAQMKSGHPKLVYKNYWIERKVIDMTLTGDDSLYKSFPEFDVASVFPNENLEEAELVDSHIVGVWIANEPKTRNKYSISEDTVAHITFFTQNRKVEIEGRWWFRDKPLYPKEADFELLRKTNIEPGDPKRLVIAYKMRDGQLFYPFGYHTFDQMAKERKEVNLGKGKINFQIVFEGVNLEPTPPLKFVLDGSYDNITIKRI